MDASETVNILGNSHWMKTKYSTEATRPKISERLMLGGLGTGLPDAVRGLAVDVRLP